MEDATADGLAGAGGLLAAASLALPWFSVAVSDALAPQVPDGLSLGHESGWAALGGWHWAVLALALLAGWSGARRIRAELPVLAALGLLAVTAAQWLSPPAPDRLVADALPSADPLAAAFAESFVRSFTETIGLHLVPSVGLFAAAAGAAAALYGTLSRS